MDFHGEFGGHCRRGSLAGESTPCEPKVVGKIFRMVAPGAGGNPCVENRGMRRRTVIFLLARGRKVINVPARREAVDSRSFIP
jgi:hypothetical protein